MSEKKKKEERQLVFNIDRIMSQVEARTDRRPTMQEVAEAADITYQGLNKWIRSVNIQSFHRLKKLSDWSGVSMDQILIYEDEK